MSEDEKTLTDAYYWLSMYKSGAITEGVAMEKVKEAMLKQPQLNDNQKIVLEWLKNEISENDLQYTLWSFTEDVYEKLEIGAGLAPYVEAWEKLKEKQKIEVLAAFAQWGLEQEEAE